MKVAKPSEKDFDAVYALLQAIEEMVERGTYTAGEEARSRKVSTGGSSWDIVEKLWRKAGPAWQRLLWAGRTAIENCCDPNAGALELKPEIELAVDCHAELLAACELWDQGFTDGEEFDHEQFLKWVNDNRRAARAAIAKAKGRQP